MRTKIAPGARTACPQVQPRMDTNEHESGRHQFGPRRQDAAFPSRHVHRNACEVYETLEPTCRAAKAATCPRTPKNAGARPIPGRRRRLSLERGSPDLQRVWTERRIRQTPHTVELPLLLRLGTAAFRSSGGSTAVGNIRVDSWLLLNPYSSEQSHQSRRAKMPVVRKRLLQSEPPHDRK